MKKRYVIVPAGGSGTRMGTDLPKQFLELDGKPVLRRTVEVFLGLSVPAEVILVMNGAYRDYWKAYCRESPFRLRHVLTDGGITRFHSVRNGLRYVEPGGVVAVHDAVRPFLTPELAESLFDLAEREGSAVPYLEMTDSVRQRLDAGGDGTAFLTGPADRSRLISVQTPQVFRSEWLLDAYERPYAPSFTDDASVVEAAGYPLHFLRGSRWNIKLTTPEDWAMAGLFSALSAGSL